MEIQDFISRYRNAFGEGVPLPLIFYYSDNKTADTEKIPGCFSSRLRM